MKNKIIYKMTEKIAQEKSIKEDEKYLRFKKPKDMPFSEWRKELIRLYSLGLIKSTYNAK